MPKQINDIMYLGATRLRKLRRDRDFTVKGIAAALGMKHPGYLRYERGQTIPPPEKLTKLAEVFGVTTDYLLGTNTEATPELTAFALDTLNSHYTGAARAHFEELMKWAGSDRNRLAVVVQKLHALNQELNK